MNNIYRILSASSLGAGSYVRKFMFVAVAGICLPLLGMAILLAWAPFPLTPFSVFATALFCALPAVVLTCRWLKGLLQPVMDANTALHDYRISRQAPHLPLHYTDEAGELMRSVQTTVTELNDLLDEKQILSELIAHDLKMPVVNIRLMTGLLPAVVHNEPQLKEVIENIHLSLEEQEGLLQQVADLIRQHDSISTSMKRLPSSLNSSLSHAIRNQQPTATHKNIRILFQPERDYELLIAPEMFQQALKNIINNAIKFSHTGSDISIQTGSNEETVYIDIADEGIGFTETQGAALFERHKKGQKGTAGEESTGLGLYLTRKILEGHQATITAASEGPGKGARFRISFCRH